MNQYSNNNYQQINNGFGIVNNNNDRNNSNTYTQNIGSHRSPSLDLD